MQLEDAEPDETAPQRLSLTLNGAQRTVKIASDRLLIDLLRDDFRLLGTMPSGGRSASSRSSRSLSRSVKLKPPPRPALQ